MDPAQARASIVEAVNEAKPGSEVDYDQDPDLAEVLDSLELMNFLFALERRAGRKLEAVTEDTVEYRVSFLERELCRTIPRA